MTITDVTFHERNHEIRKVSGISLLLSGLVLLCSCITFAISDDTWVQALSAATAVIIVLGAVRETRR